MSARKQNTAIRSAQFLQRSKVNFAAKLEASKARPNQNPPPRSPRHLLSSSPGAGPVSSPTKPPKPKVVRVVVPTKMITRQQTKSPTIPKPPSRKRLPSEELGGELEAPSKRLKTRTSQAVPPKQKNRKSAKVQFVPESDHEEQSPDREVQDQAVVNGVRSGDNPDDDSAAEANEAAENHHVGAERPILRSKGKRVHYNLPHEADSNEIASSPPPNMTTRTTSEPTAPDVFDVPDDDDEDPEPSFNISSPRKDRRLSAKQRPEKQDRNLYDPPSSSDEEHSTLVQVPLWGLKAAFKTIKITEDNTYRFDLDKANEYLRDCRIALHELQDQYGDLNHISVPIKLKTIFQHVNHAATIMTELPDTDATQELPVNDVFGPLIDIEEALKALDWHVQDQQQYEVPVYGMLLFVIVGLICHSLQLHRFLDYEAELQESLTVMNAIIVLAAKCRSWFNRQRIPKPVSGLPRAAVSKLLPTIKSEKRKIQDEIKSERREQAIQAKLVETRKRLAAREEDDRFEAMKIRMRTIFMLRQGAEPNPSLQITKFGGLRELEEYWRSGDDEVEEFVYVKGTWTDMELNSLFGAIRIMMTAQDCKFTGLVQFLRLTDITDEPRTLWKNIFNKYCGFRGALQNRTADEILLVTKALAFSTIKSQHSQQKFADDFWYKIPDLHLCSLLPRDVSGYEQVCRSY